MKRLFNYWDNLKKELRDKYIMLFLDYDGILTPIVEKPEKANISLRTKELLERLSEDSDCKVAIISGRSLKDIKNKVGIKNIIYSGNHGLEIEGPKIKFKSQITPRDRAILEQIKPELSKKLASIKGAILEDKGLSLSLHYRLVDRQHIPQVKTILHETTFLYKVRNKIKIKSGKMVFEIRLPLEWDKGKVVLWLLARQKFILADRTLAPIYIGDDTTDEDAFEVLRDRGLTIFVGNPKKSYAKYYLRNTRDVSKFLRRILEIQKE